MNQTDLDVLKSHFEILYNDSPNPCSITDIETHEVVFMNYAMTKMLKDSLGYTKKAQRPLKCFEQMYGRKDPCSFCANDTLVEDEFIESYVYHPMLQKHFRVDNTKLRYKGRFYNQCKYFVTSSYSNQLVTFEEAMTQSVGIFSEDHDFGEMTSLFLELLGNFYECEYTYVVYFDAERREVASQYEWSKDEKQEAVNILASRLPLPKLISWMEHNAKDGMVHADPDKNTPDPTEAQKKLLRMFGVSNFCACLIENEKNECIGAVGMANRAEKPFDKRLMKAITKFIKDGFKKSDMRDELKNISDTDFLTGFFSRPRYATDLAHFEQFPPKQLGAVFINLNGLRKTNQHLGFQKGDEQIANAANTLRRFFAEDFYRISGDEFVCFCQDKTEQGFTLKVNNLRNELKARGDYPFAVGHAWKTGTVDVEQLVSEADTVMYINKQEYYHSTHKESSSDHDSSLNELLNYIENDEFLVYLQPQVNLKNGKLVGAEALIRRFDKANQKMVFPDQFIPHYEQKSIIRHVDLYVLKKVCQILTQWGIEKGQVPISVNLSRVTLIEYDIVNTIADICDAHNIPHEFIIIEITERIGLIENDVATTLIDEFQAKGFQVSLDDFGCAYSNIVTLANITVNEVKIDKSLVDNLETNFKNRIIVRNMVAMCNEFPNTHTLAEGIETKEQAEILCEYGCSSGQGYFYDRPMPNQDFFEKYIKNNQGSP
ncbi:MAG: bifunctional diguanylate cyclase/phosphodiesterase [Eubacteriales bacterium]